MNEVVYSNLQEKIIFALFLILLVWAPIPLGSNRDIGWTLLSTASTILLAWSAALLSVRRMTLTKSFFRLKLVYLMFIALVSLQIAQVVLIPIDIIKQYSPQHLGKLSLQDIYVGAEALSISVDRNQTIEYLIRFISYISVFLLTVLLVNGNSRLVWLLLAMSVSGVLQSIYGIGELIYNYAATSAFTILHGTFVNNNHFAAYLNMVVGSVLGLLLLATYSNRSGTVGFIRSFGTQQFSVTVYLILCIVALLLAQSRGAGIAFVVAFLSVFVLININDKGKEWFGRRMVGLALLLLFMIFLFGNKIIIDELKNVDTDMLTRMEIWEISLQIFKDFPLFGVGAGNFATVFPVYESRHMSVFVNHVHNDYIQVLVEQGISGFAIMAILILLCIGAAFRILRASSNVHVLVATSVGMFGVVSMLVHALVDFNFYIPSNAAYFFVFLGLSVANIDKVKKATRARTRTSQTAIDEQVLERPAFTLSEPQA
ncbi:MAG: O-antigen ligase family protein [Gammaproteobacteria bacterium]|nr:O-antigen ligase family protein [Gammaproteobacteria bacterium]